MAILLVTYDLKAPGRNYQPVWDYLETFDHCKGLESVWLLDTTESAATVRDELTTKVDGNDKIFVVKLQKSWAALRFGCSAWLKEAGRSW